MRRRARHLGSAGLVCTTVLGAAWLASGVQALTQSYQGLEITVQSLERSKRVSLQDCPPGANRVRGVIRPVEENEFATVRIDVKVLPSFEPVELGKPVVYDEEGTEYKTAQSFRELNKEPSYSCSFSFRVPTGTKLARFVIDEASFDLTSLGE